MIWTLNANQRDAYVHCLGYLEDLKYLLCIPIFIIYWCGALGMENNVNI